MTEASSGIHDHEDDQPTRELPQNEEVFYSDLERVRGALGFASSRELRARAATVFTSGRYARPTWLTRRRVLVDTAAQTATEGLRRDIGVMNGNAMADVDQARTIELDNVMSIPRPADFPVLTAAQLTEAEQRVSTILRRIEQELDNVEQEEAAALRRLQGYDPYGATEHISSQDWNERMERLVSTRLELKYQHAKDPVILDWHRKGLHEASSPLRQARGGVTGVQRGLVGARTDNAPPQGGVGGGGPALVGGNVGLRARNASATKSLALAKSGPLFPDMLNAAGVHTVRAEVSTCEGSGDFRLAPKRATRSVEPTAASTRSHGSATRTRWSSHGQRSSSRRRWRRWPGAGGWKCWPAGSQCKCN
ncbi:Hypothetical protein, putative [Bodo saltans]|uniref:Uncharacterized protein n=1 Tax=Bodo saltans TaxID=75058 RepID=A0A0S4KDY9_BODSA|nr:Hypothetical protein, putative [Bodo saltans]|eukprot:CUI11979.1 Hypothetical protein, putative [Bodo saltans]